MALRHYRYAGLRVASELELPEWSAFAAPAEPADVTIHFSRASVATETDAQAGPDGCAFFIPEVGRFAVHRSGTIHVTALPEAELRTVRVFVLGSAWGALCYLRGVFVLHASVAQVDGRAVAFCGASGAGKSSLVAWLSSQGARMVADDLCRVDVSGEDALRVHPGPPRVKLWREAADALEWSGAPLERDHARMDKFHFAATREPLPGPVPLAGVCVLEWGEANTERLHGAAALRALVAAATYRGDLLDQMGILARHWQQCADLAARIPVWRHSRPRDWNAVPGTAATLLRLFSAPSPELESGQ